MSESVQFGWMTVAVLGQVLLYFALRHRSAPAVDPRLAAMAEKFSAWPDPEEVLERLDELEEELKSLKSSGATLPAIVARANDITKDMLALKNAFVSLRDEVTSLRSKQAFKALSGTTD